MYKTNGIIDAYVSQFLNIISTSLPFLSCLTSEEDFLFFNISHNSKLSYLGIKSRLQ